MAPSMLRVALTALLLLGAAAGPGGAQAPQQEQQRVPAPDRHPATGLSFPAQIANAQKLHSMDYGKSVNRPDLGYGWTYKAGQQLLATVYVYTMGVQNIPDGPSSAPVRAQFDRSLADIHEAAKYNRYEGLRTASGPTDCAVGGVVFRCVTLAGIQSSTRQPIFTALMLTGYRKHFLKLRLDWVEGSATSQAMVDRFVQTLVGAMLR